MNELDPREVATRIAEERKQLRRNSAQKTSNTQRRYEMEYRRDLREQFSDEVEL